MTNHIYYGEYSLKHWIRLLLSKNIELPEYQRNFVWEASDIKRLLRSLKEKQFIQPVTIALYKSNNGESRNLLIDGQQRLTSILLAGIGYLPNKEKFEKPEAFASDDDSDEETINVSEPIKWTYRELLSDIVSENSLKSIKNRLKNDERYIEYIDEELDESFFEDTFLGFSYIVPDSNDEREIQHSFTKLFRNINYFGMRLSPQESRQSLYYMNEDIKQFFEGRLENGESVLGDIKIMENMKTVNIDFVRYLSILSQYIINNDSSKVLLGYSAYKSRESYYADYVSYLLNIEQESREDKFNGFNFNEVFPNQDRKQRLINLYNTLNSIKDHFDLNERHAFKSWIDADYWLFGLIYHVLFKNNKLNYDSLLFTTILDTIEERKRDSAYKRTPNGLSNIRQRLAESINLYSKYVY